jgi:hypothetical protein
MLTTLFSVSKHATKKSFLHRTVPIIELVFHRDVRFGKDDLTIGATESTEKAPQPSVRWTPFVKGIFQSE